MAGRLLVSACTRVLTVCCLFLWASGGLGQTEPEKPGQGKSDQGKSANKDSVGVAFGTPPLVRLIRDPQTVSELSLTPSQTKAIDDLLARVDSRLWRIRDYPINKVGEQGKTVVTEFENGLRKVLDERQQLRLKQITRQIQSWRGIAQPEMAREIGLTKDQVGKLESIFEESSKKQASMKASDAPALKQAQEQERELVAKVLDASQQMRLTELVGKPFDFGKLKHLWTKAPEFAATSEWLQSKPLKLSDQRGKVVVVHFFAFGCINCIHNYPWYRDWAEKYAASDVVIIGIHTPETEAERNVASLEKKVKENKLTFPVAVDNDKKNWEAWGNNMWPSVYLIDKEGFVRAWWYGELDWQGAGGQKVLSQRIEELLKETPRSP